MRLSVACNFDEALLEGLKDHPVYELYGKVTEDFVGGGRPSFFLPEVSRRKVERFVERAHKMGFEFNYLLNAVCMGNAEYTREGQRAIRKTLDWICEMGCESVTVAHLYLLQIIKKCYPHLKVRISAHCFTDTVRKARFWEEHGADCIVLNETAISREFGTLRAIRSAVKCDLSLIVNNSCRQECAIALGHATNLNHASQKRRGDHGFPLDYHMLFCLEYRLRDPVHYIRANWIRPEDLHHYEAIGFDNFKIVERNAPTPELLKRVHAYANRRYDGNLFDLILPFNYPQDSSLGAIKDIGGRRRALRYFFKPHKVNLLKFLKLSRLGRHMNVLLPRSGESPLYLDNRKLDGFIDRFLSASCMNVDCEKCRYCHRFAEKAVRIDPAYRREVLALYREIFQDMFDGSFWEPVRPRDFTDIVRMLRRAVSRSASRLKSSKVPPPTCPLEDE